MSRRSNKSINCKVDYENYDRNRCDKCGKRNTFLSTTAQKKQRKTFYKYQIMRLRILDCKYQITEYAKIYLGIPETYSELSQTPNIECFTKRSISDVSLGSEYVSPYSVKTFLNQICTLTENLTKTFHDGVNAIEVKSSNTVTTHVVCRVKKNILNYQPFKLLSILPEPASINEVRYSEFQLHKDDQ